MHSRPDITVAVPELPVWGEELGGKCAVDGRGCVREEGKSSGGIYMLTSIRSEGLIESSVTNIY